jgi:hypothetical protein
LERLRAGLVDLAVGPLMQVPADIEFHPVVSYDPVVITCLGHPLAYRERLTLEDISRYPLILPPRPAMAARLRRPTYYEPGFTTEEQAILICFERTQPGKGIGDFFRLDDFKPPADAWTALTKSRKSLGSNELKLRIT